MKKVVRFFLVCAGVLLLLVVAAGILAFQPSVQTWVARKVVAEVPGMEISIGRVNAGLNRVEVAGVRVRHAESGVVIDLPSAAVEVPLREVLRGRVDVGNFVARGWTVDLSQAAVAFGVEESAKTTKSFPHEAQGCDAVATLGKHENIPTTSKRLPRVENHEERQPLRGCEDNNPDTQGRLLRSQPWAIRGNGFAVKTQSSSTLNTCTEQQVDAAARQALFPGVFELVKLPIDLTVGHVDVDGTVILPPREAGGQAARVTVAARGGRLAPGSEARLEIASGVKMPGEGAPVSNMQIQGTLIARMGAARAFEALGLDVNASAAGAQFPQGARIRAQVGATRGEDGERYTVVLKAEERNLISLFVFPVLTGKEAFEATVAFDLRDTDLEPFIMGLGLHLPVFATEGTVRLWTDRTLQPIRAEGNLLADVSKLERIHAELRVLGSVSLDTVFKVVRTGDLVRVNALSAHVYHVASVQVLQPVEVNIATGDLKVSDINADLVRVDLAGLPLDWVRPFIKDIGFDVTGGALRGSIVGRAGNGLQDYGTTDLGRRGGLGGRAGNGGVSLRSVAPLSLGRISVAQQQQTGELARPLVKDVDVSTGFTADYTSAGWNATVSGFSLRWLGTQIFTLDAKAGGAVDGAGVPVPAISATGTLHANLAALMAQPGAADFQLLSFGLADVDFDAQVAPDVQRIAARLALARLRGNDLARTAMPGVSGELKADVRESGEISVRAPLVFELESRRSDIDLNATIKPDGARRNIDATILAGEIHVGDLQRFAALAPSDKAAGSPAASRQRGQGEQDAPPTLAPAQTDTKAVWDAFTGQVKLDIKKLFISPDMQAANVNGSLRVTPSLFSLENFRAAMSDGGEAWVSGAVRFGASGTAGAGQLYDAVAKVSVTDFNPAPVLVVVNPGRRPVVDGKFDIAGTVKGKSATIAGLAESAEADVTITSRGGTFNGFAATDEGDKPGGNQMP